MAIAELQLTPRPRNYLPSRGAQAAISVVHGRAEEARLADWSRVINQLRQWLRNPSVLEEEDYLAPSAEILIAAVQLAEEAQRAGLTPATRVAPNGEGGIVFEQRSGPRFQSMSLEPTGQIETLLYDGGSLHSREFFNWQPEPEQG